MACLNIVQAREKECGGGELKQAFQNHRKDILKSVRRKAGNELQRKKI